MKEFKLFATLIQVAFIVYEVIWCYSLVMAIGYFTNFAIFCMDGFQNRSLGFLRRTRNQKESREFP